MVQKALSVEIGRLLAAAMRQTYLDVMGDLRAARKSEYLDAALETKPGQVRQTLDRRIQPLGDDHVFACHGIGIEPVAVTDRRSDKQPVVPVGRLDQRAPELQGPMKRHQHHTKQQECHRDVHRRAHVKHLFV